MDRILSLLCRHGQIYTTSLADKFLSRLKTWHTALSIILPEDSKTVRVQNGRLHRFIRTPSTSCDDRTGRDLIGLLRNCSCSNCQKAPPVQNEVPTHCTKSNSNPTVCQP
jgi:hypothetical protein